MLRQRQNRFGPQELFLYMLDGNLPGRTSSEVTCVCAITRNADCCGAPSKDGRIMLCPHWPPNESCTVHSLDMSFLPSEFWNWGFMTWIDCVEDGLFWARDYSTPKNEIHMCVVNPVTQSWRKLPHHQIENPIGRPWAPTIVADTIRLQVSKRLGADCVARFTVHVLVIFDKFEKPPITHVSSWGVLTFDSETGNWGLSEGDSPLDMHNYEILYNGVIYLSKDHSNFQQYPLHDGKLHKIIDKEDVDEKLIVDETNFLVHDGNLFAVLQRGVVTVVSLGEIEELGCEEDPEEIDFQMERVTDLQYEIWMLDSSSKRWTPYSTLPEEIHHYFRHFKWCQFFPLDIREEMPEHGCLGLQAVEMVGDFICLELGSLQSEDQVHEEQPTVHVVSFHVPTKSWHLAPYTLAPRFRDYRLFTPNFCIL